MSNVKRRGSFFCNHTWVYVNDSDWTLLGTYYYKWCDSCDRFEHLEFIYSSDWPEEKAEKLANMGLSDVEFLPLVSGPGPDGKIDDYIQRHDDKFGYEEITSNQLFGLFWTAIALIAVVFILL